MTTLKEIERAIMNLSSDELSKFRDWYRTFDHENGDSQIQDDVEAGRLSDLMAKAKGDFSAGKCKEL